MGSQGCTHSHLHNHRPPPLQPDYKRGDSFSTHTGCPVIKGVKWNAVKWIHGIPFRGERREECGGESVNIHLNNRALRGLGPTSKGVVGRGAASCVAVRWKSSRSRACASLKSRSTGPQIRRSTGTMHVAGLGLHLMQLIECDRPLPLLLQPILSLSPSGRGVCNLRYAQCAYPRSPLHSPHLAPFQATRMYIATPFSFASPPPPPRRRVCKEPDREACSGAGPGAMYGQSRDVWDLGQGGRVQEQPRLHGELGGRRRSMLETSFLLPSSGI